VCVCYDIYIQLFCTFTHIDRKCAADHTRYKAYHILFFSGGMLYIYIKNCGVVKKNTEGKERVVYSLVRFFRVGGCVSKKYK
jgi:hypothetical protein